MFFLVSMYLKKKEKTCNFSSGIMKENQNLDIQNSIR